MFRAWDDAGSLGSPSLHRELRPAHRARRYARRVAARAMLIGEAVGTAIRELRGERGVRQNEVARASDLEPALLSHIVNGRGNPTWGTLSRISAGLGVPLSELLARAERHAEAPRRAGA